jgi:hypothetical protein
MFMAQHLQRIPFIIARIHLLITQGHLRHSGIPRAFHSSLELALYNVALFETLIRMCAVC